MNQDFSHRLGDGKKTLMIYAQGQAAPGIFQNSFDTNKVILSMLGFNIQDTIVAAGTADPGDVLKKEGAMEKACAAGKALAAI